MDKKNIGILIMMLIMIYGLSITAYTDSWNMDQLGYFLPPFIAYDVALNSTYAYIATYTGFHVVDISNPFNPTQIGFKGTTSEAYAITVVGNYAYIATRGSGLRVFDISSASNPVEVGHFDMTENGYDIKVVENYAYIAAYPFGLRILDISDPQNPYEVGQFRTPDGNAFYIAIQDNYAFLSASSTGLWIIDISDPSNPYGINHFVMSGKVYGIAFSRNYAYVAQGTTGLHILDISNPENPFEVGYIDTPGTAYAVAVNGDYAFVADGSGSGVRVIDIKNPSYPKEVGYYSFNGYNARITVQGNNVYILELYYGLHILQFKSDIENIPDVKLMKGGSLSRLIDLNNYLLSTTTTSWTWSSQTTFANITISADNRVDYLSPLSANAGQDTVIFATPDSGKDKSILKYSSYLLNRLPEVWVKDGQQVANCAMDLSFYLTKDSNAPDPIYSATWRYLYADDSNHLKVQLDNNLLSIKPNLNPKQIGIYDTPGSYSATAIQGNYAYVVDWLNGLRVVDINNPTVPFEVGWYDIAYASRIKVQGNYAYVVDELSNLHIVDISNPMLPNEVYIYPGEYRSYQSVALDVSAEYAVIFYSAMAKIKILNISDPLHPVMIGQYFISDYSSGVWPDIKIVGNDIYYCYGNYFRIIDFSDPSSPMLIGHYYNSSMYAQSLSIQDHFAYLADTKKGFYIIDISNPTTPVEIGKYIETSGGAYSIYVRDSLAFLAYYRIGLRVFDVSNPVAPYEVSSCQVVTPGTSYPYDYANNIIVSGNYAYLSAITSGLHVFDIGSNAISLHRPTEITVTVANPTTTSDWDKEIIRVYEIVNNYGEFSTGSDTSHWYFEKYSDGIHSGILSWSSTYQIAAVSQMPADKAKLSQVFTVPVPGWYTAKAVIDSDIVDITQRQKVYLYLQEFNQDTELVAAASQILYSGGNAFDSTPGGKEMLISFYSHSTILGIQLVSINPITGVSGTLYFDNLWVYPAEPQVSRAYGATKVDLVNAQWESDTNGWMFEPYGDSNYAGVWTTAYSMLCLTQYGGDKGKASQLFHLPNVRRNASVSVWVYSDATSLSHTQKVYLYLYGYDSSTTKIIESGNAVLYPGKWIPGQWHQLQFAYTPVSNNNVIQLVGINPIGNDWETVYLNDLELNQDQDSPYYWDHTLF